MSDLLDLLFHWEACWPAVHWRAADAGCYHPDPV
jgi:hypothetical protein